MIAFQRGVKSEANKQLQQKLIKAGFPPESDPPDDGIYGTETTKALDRFQKYHGIVLDPPVVDQRTYDILFERNTFVFPQINSQWLSGIVANTAFKYVVTAICTYVAAKLGLDQGNLTALVFQLIGIIAGVWGMWEAAKSKVVVNGVSVNLAKVPANDQQKAVEIVKNANAKAA